VVSDLRLGGKQAELGLHQLDEQGTISFGEDNPGEERVQGQAEMGHALLALPQADDELVYPPGVLLFEVEVVGLPCQCQRRMAVVWSNGSRRPASRRS
jgi:hypothetical protein